MFPVSQGGVGGGKKGSRKSEEWTINCLQLVHSAHQALSALYEHLDTGENTAPPEPPGLRCPQIPEGGSLEQLADFFLHQCRALTTVLCTPVEGAVRFPMGVILCLVARCLGISYKDVTNLPSLMELATALPTLQQSALELLSCLILCCGSNLLPHSRLILDHFQQVLVSTQHMETSQKSMLRSCVYHVLCEWVKVAGMGRHFQSQLSSFVQEMISDIQLVRPHQGTNGTDGSESISATSLAMKGTGKGKQRKKNKIADSYKDLPAPHDASEGGEIDSCKSVPGEATVSALELSKVILERGQFMQLQKLIRHILEMASSLQRSDVLTGSPYSQSICRLQLYQAIWNCAQIPLEIGAGTGDTVAHFQQTNQAMSLISCASHTDRFVEVRSFCKELLLSMRSFGCLQRPIVRKILPDDGGDSHDVSETMREAERLSEENEMLRKRLVDVEMERHSQSRLVTSLREELEELRASQAEREASSKMPDNDLEKTDEEGKQEKEEADVANSDEMDADVTEKTEEAEEKVHKEDNRVRKDTQTSDAKKRKGKKRKKKSTAGLTTPNSEQTEPLTDDEHDPPEVKKRSAPVDERSAPADVMQEKGDKKQKGDNASSENRSMPWDDNQPETGDNEDESAHVQEMLLDFVDAGPDD